MKKLCSLLLAAAMVVSLASCNNSSGTNPSGGAASNGEFKPSNKTLTLIVPYAAGGAVDLGARLMAKYAANYTDIDIVINNVTGGSGTVGAAEMLKYKNDGTYMLAYNPSMANVSTSDKPLTYDCTKDLAMVSMMVQDERLLTIHKDETRYTTIEEFIEYAKNNPVNVGCSGTGNVAYYYPILLAQAAGFEKNLTVVPFDGSAEAKTALLGKHIDAASQSYSDIAADPTQFIVLCSAGTERIANLPDVPTLKEKGYDLNLFVSRGFAMKAGTDEKIVKYWSDVIGKVCENEDFLAEAANLGLPIRYMDYEEFTQDNLTEMALYTDWITSGLLG